MPEQFDKQQRNERRDKGRKKKKQNDIDRQPPFNLEAEVGVLGSIMIKPDICDELVNILRADDFYDPAHVALYRHLMEMHDAAKKIDLTLLRSKLMDSEDYDLVGGPAGLARIMTAVPHAAHGMYYAEIVREAATKRELITASTDILTEAYDPTQESEPLLNLAEQKVFAIREGRQSTSLSQVNEVLTVALDRIEARIRGEHQEGTVETGFADLDRMTNGLHASELVILAARPSMGKTAFAMNIAENVVTKSNKPVLFISLEMAAIELVERLICSAARVNGHKLRTGTLSKDDQQKVISAAGQLGNAPLFVDDSPTRNVSEIAGAARRIIRKNNGQLGLIVIDYLQLIQPDSQRDPRQEQVAKIARRLKGLARELKVPILCLAQLNRQAEDSRDHRPRLSHLRESGAIEQDADVVMFVHRDDYYATGEEAEEKQGQAQIIICKQRNGPVGDVELTWIREYTRFEDRAPERFSEFDSPAPAFN